MKDCQSQILEYLRAGNELTVLTAIKLFGTTELRRIVSRLRDKGYNIVSQHSPEGNHNIYRLERSEQMVMF